MTAVTADNVDAAGSSDTQAGRTRRGARLGEWFALYGTSIFAALVLSAILVEVTGGDWQPVVSALLDGGVRRPGRWGETLATAAPLLIVAVGTVISSKAGLVNIGQEGQLYVGAAIGAYFGFLIGGPGPINVVLILIIGAAGGGLWAGVAAGLRYWRGVPEVLSTLLLVTVGGQAVAYALRWEWLLLAPEGRRGNRNQVSEQLATDNRLPRPDLFGNEFPLTVFISVVLAVIVAFALSRTVWGFRLRMLGRNPRAAQRSGVSETRYGAMALMLSGAFAGLAGAAMLTGGGFAFGNYQIVPGFASNIGWTGLLVALVAYEKPLAAIPVAVVFAGLRTGSNFVSSTGVESRITDVISGLLVLALLIPAAVMFLRDRRRARAAATERV